MTFHGRIRNGVAVLDTPVSIPDGTPVRIEVDSTNESFWRNRKIEELAREQNVATHPTLDDLAGDWPADDSIDEFLNLIREARR